MTIQYCSDLHLEFKENSKWLQQHPIQPMGEVLLLAGDIVPFAEMDGYGHFFDSLAQHFELTLWVPGNHEYYYADAAERSGAFTEKIRENVLLVNDTVIVHQGVRFICSTLWSEISPDKQWWIQQRMSDFSVISYRGKPFTVADFNRLHHDSKAFIVGALAQERDTPTLVVTHHIPTLMHYPEQYKGDTLNEAFAVELFDLIETSSAEYWLYGHHHSNTAKFNIGETKLITNQLGYVQYNEHWAFDTGKVFSL